MSEVARAWLGFLCFVCLGVISAFADDVEVGNERFVLHLGDDGTVRSLVLKATGEELADLSEPVPFFTVTQERPYVNEVKLAHPNKRTEYRATALRREGDRLIVGFEHGQYEAAVSVKTTPAYVALTLEEFLVPIERRGRRVIACWNMRGAAAMVVDLGTGERTVPVDKMRYLETALDKDAAKAAFAACRERVSKK